MKNKFRFLAMMLIGVLLSVNLAWGGDYVKVTVALDDWSGDYVIATNDADAASNKMFILDASLSTIDAVNNYFAADYNSKTQTITADDSKSFTIAPVSGGYSVMTNDGWYLQPTAKKLNIDEDKAAAHTITFNSADDITLGTVGTAILRFNTSSGQDRFRYYASGQQAIQLYKKASITYTDLSSGHKSGHFQPSFLALSQIVIWGFFAFFCKKVFHIRCTEGAWRMHGGSRPSSQPLFSPFGTLFAIAPTWLIPNWLIGRPI